MVASLATDVVLNLHMSVVRDSRITGYGIIGPNHILFYINTPAFLQQMIFSFLCMMGTIAYAQANDNTWTASPTAIPTARPTTLEERYPVGLSLIHISEPTRPY